MTKGKRAMKIIGTVAFCFSGLYFCLLNLCESIGFISNLIHKSPFKRWFDTGNDSIITYFFYISMICLVGFVLLAIAYRKDKKFLPLIGMLPLIPLSYFVPYNAPGIWTVLCIIYVLLIAALFAYAIWLAVRTENHEKA